MPPKHNFFKVSGVLINKKDNSTYLIFQLTPIDFHDPVPDQREIDDARYFSLSEIEELSQGSNARA